MPLGVPRPTAPPPLPAFDPERERPPVSCVQVVFEAPMTVNMLYGATGGGDEPELAAAVHAAREAAVETAMKTVCDYVQLKVGEHSPMPRSSWTVGRYADGQLFVTRVAHIWALDRHGDPFDDAPRLHDHVFVATTGIDHATGQRWPIDIDGVQRAAIPGQALYEGVLETELRKRTGIPWLPRDVTGTEQAELGVPGFRELAAQFPRRRCSQPHSGSMSSLLWYGVDERIPPSRRDPDAS
jgi:TrwC relaxase